MKEAEKLRVIEDGKRLREEWNRIDPEKPSYCPTCKQEIKLTPENKKALEDRKQELGTKIQEKLQEYSALDKEIGELKGMYGNSDDLVREINGKLQILNQEISTRMSEKTNQIQIRQRLEKVEKDLEKVQQEFSSLGAPEKVELPEGFMQKMSEIETSLNS